MFSERFDWDLGPNSLSTLLQTKKSNRVAICDLAESNPTRVGLDYDAEEILSAISQPQSMRYDPNPRGLEKARRAIADYYGTIGERIHSDSVILTAGTSEAYSIIFKLLGNPGDEVLVPRPGYPLLSHLAGFEGLRTFSYPLRHDDTKGWAIDLDILEALITPKTKAVVVVNPNNPTGSYLKQHELSTLDSLCRRHGIALVVDEVFSDFHATETPERITTAVNRSEALTFVLNGLSKMVGLPQMKLGWIVVGGYPDVAKAALSRLETITDFYLTVSTPVQHAAERLIGLRKVIQRQILSRITANARFLEAQTSRTSNIHTLPREGGWYAIVRISDDVTDEDRILQLLEHDNTLVHPGYFYEFDTEGFVVVSLLPTEETFRTGISRLVGRFGNEL